MRDDSFLPSPGRRNTCFVATGVNGLAADRIEVDGRAECLFLHGAGVEGKRPWSPLREALADMGTGSIAIDFSGHGDSLEAMPMSLARRYVEAKAALSLFRRDEPRVIVGISMSGEIAIRLAGDPDNGVAGLVTLVGAVYAPEAFSVPFGPDFTRILRQPGSWRRSEAFSIMRRIRGHVSIIQAESDRVVPLEIGERLLRCAVRAGSAELIELPDVDHALTAAFDANPALVQSVAALIQTSIGRAKRLRRASADA